MTLHLTDGRRVHGFPKQFPDSPDSGHFLIINAEWLENGQDRVVLSATHTLLMPAANVEFVEIMFEPDEVAERARVLSHAEGSDGQQSGSVSKIDQGAERGPWCERRGNIAGDTPGVTTTTEPAESSSDDQQIIFNGQPT